MITTSLEAYRAEFPMTRNYAFLTHASVAPLPARSAAAATKVLEMQQTAPFEELLPVYVELLDGVKRKLAALIKASPEEVVLMPNTATGVNTAANSLPLRAGDNVLVLEGDYPANVYPWWNLASKGVLTKTVPARNGGLDLDLLASRVDERTRVVALSSVMFSNGFRNDLKAVGRFCRERDIRFFVDAIQSLGALELDVEDCCIDMLASGSHKWLMAGMGCGFFYCRASLLDRLQPGAYVGAFSVVDPFNFLDYNFTLQPSAERFAIGTLNYAGAAALGASLDLLAEVGGQRIERRVHELVAIARADLAGRGFRVLSCPENPSGILTVELPDPEAACQRLLRERIVTAVRGGALRLAPHFYNTEDELLRVGEVLDHS